MTTSTKLKPQSTQEKHRWISDQYLRADNAVQAIRAVQRSYNQEKNAEVRRLEEFKQTLRSKNNDTQQLELFDIRETLTIELAAILHAHNASEN